MPSTFEFRLNIVGPQKSWTYVIPIRPEPIIIGRLQGNEILLEYQRVSRRHAFLQCTASECTLVDIDSANGTRLNGQALTHRILVVLKTGDRIQIGDFTLEFEQIPLELPSEADLASPLPSKDVPQQVSPPEFPPLPPAPPAPHFDPSQPPPGLTFRSERLLGYLPSIYHTEFMANFLGIFEAVLFPIEWQIDSFDLLLDPRTTPEGFLPWLAHWFDFVFDSTWSEAQRRIFLKEAYSLYSRAGTRRGLRRLLEIYCGREPDVDDESDDLPPHTFRVRIQRVDSLNQEDIERLINACKPAHTAYILELVE